jgi:hypothetical protein
MEIRNLFLRDLAVRKARLAQRVEVRANVRKVLLHLTISVTPLLSMTQDLTSL